MKSLSSTIEKIIASFDKEFTQIEINQSNNWKTEGASAKKIKAFFTEKLQEVERETYKEVAELLYQLTDEEECSFDHHGYCQTHSWFSSEEKCVNKRALEYLSYLKRSEGKE